MLILLGKSGSGKDTIANFLVDHCGYRRIITYTTRPIRPGETQDVQYHFISDEEFQEKVSHGFFLEYKVYHTEFGDWYYGSAKEDFEKADYNTLVILTPEGYLDLLWNMKEITHDAVYIKVDVEELQRRLKERGDNELESIRRLAHDNKDFEFVEDIVDRVVINQNKTIEEVVYDEILRM